MIAASIKYFSAIVIVACQCTSAWIQAPATGTWNRRVPITTPYISPNGRAVEFHSKLATTTDDEGEKDDDIGQDDSGMEQANVQWGVSYIGGDPCGSKYNSDPFDKNPSDKPGLPADMKARIEALAQKKLRERESNN
mmetsp:Transcript_25788/g.55116  ORF Transcript_25788/g.55116 Transcript_25788/m.55116 type:complete len:137 (+) Transcript_25788:112-522(+)|eukprot:CAMPEP_0201117274 /NCGR_PEP_ID=MMETSP0850-20130426/1272_1 /ASSEMBLY_ACC=CAM_ASM_000622 /TAXON_ID=183588 /ORGANISM="Pseudo-nitzschia fraudulenta, Strain WWA7" /LENGTH=136 /DNA_ID=CAMNT_0047381525 /DNA_START=20 /DNA_END=430 /DNA_ORIENTATION=-